MTNVSCFKQPRAVLWPVTVLPRALLFSRNPAPPASTADALPLSCQAVAPQMMTVTWMAWVFQPPQPQEKSPGLRLWTLWIFQPPRPPKKSTHCYQKVLQLLLCWMSAHCCHEDLKLLLCCACHGQWL